MESSIVAGDIGNLDLVMDIVLRLPVKSLIRFKCVSKQWLSLIADPRFCHSHTLHHQHNFPSSLLISTFPALPEPSQTLSVIPLPISNSDPSQLLVSNFDFLNAPNMILSIKHSCNGLLLVEGIKRHNDESCYFVCNPITKQFVALSSHILTPATMIHSLFLAFDPLRSPYYKVIGIIRNVTTIWLPESEYEIFMYFSETGRWNDLGICFMAPTSLELHTLAGKYLNGCIFWYDYKAESSLYFDVENQCLKTYPMPSNENGVIYFGESGGHLHMILTDFYSPFSHYVFDILELKEDYSGWSVRFHVDLTPMVGEIPYSSYIYSYVICVIRQEKEEDSVLVFCIKDMIMSYNLVNHSFQQIFKSDRAFLSQVCKYIVNLSCVGVSSDY